ncbi:MAG: FecR domain-containing protein [Pseudomonadota bacterium]
MTTDSRDYISGIDQALIAEALEWRALMADDIVANDKRAAFHAWVMSDPAHMKAFDYAERFWEQLKLVSDPDDQQAEAVLDIAAPAQSSNRRKISLIGSSVLLSVAIMAITFVVLDWQGDSLDESTTITYFTDIAESRTVSLPDGSRVVLGPGSRVETRIDDENRAVSLLSGQAYFDVTKDIQRPFSVVTGKAEISVLGTQFDVRAASNKTHIAVAEGRVQVGIAASGSNSDPAGMVALDPGQSVVLERESFGEVSNVSVDLVGAWRDNRLAFFNEPLASVVEQVNRYDRREILLADPDLAALTVSATLDASDIDSLLDTLAEIYPLAITEREEESQLVITKKN